MLPQAQLDLRDPTSKGKEDIGKGKGREGKGGKEREGGLHVASWLLGGMDAPADAGHLCQILWKF